MVLDKGRPIGHIRVEKYRQGAVKPYEVIECTNVFLSSGINELWSLVIGDSANHFDNTNARIGIGSDKSTTPVNTQTDLQGASKTYKAIETGYPTTPKYREVKFKSSFGSSDANYEWGELVVKNNISGISFNRTTNNGAGWGTKGSGETWNVIVTLKIT